jgi:hypothetical protein
MQGREQTIDAKERLAQGDRELSLRERSFMREQEDIDMMRPVKELTAKASLLKAQYDIDNFGHIMDLNNQKMQVDIETSKQQASLLKASQNDALNFTKELQLAEANNGKPLSREQYQSLAVKYPMAFTNQGVAALDKQYDQMWTAQESMEKVALENESRLINSTIRNQSGRNTQIEKSNFALGEYKAANNQPLTEEEAKDPSVKAGWLSRSADIKTGKDKAAISTAKSERSEKWKQYNSDPDVIAAKAIIQNPDKNLNTKIEEASRVLRDMQGRYNLSDQEVEESLAEEQINDYTGSVRAIMGNQLNPPWTQQTPSQQKASSTPKASNANAYTGY